MSIIGNPISAGGGGYTKPSYLISEGDSVTSLYFNCDYNKTTLKNQLADLTYTSDVQIYGYDTCALGIGNLYALSLGNSHYAIVWNAATPTIIFTSKDVFELDYVGWIESRFTASSAFTVTSVEPHFAAIMDNVVAKGRMRFGDMSTSLVVDSNGTYTAPAGEVYTSVKVNVPIASTDAPGNAIQYAYDDQTGTLTITQDPPVNAVEEGE